MQLGITSNYVYLSPRLAEGVHDPLDVQSALFHLSDHLFRLEPTQPNPFPIMEDIFHVVNRYVEAQDARARGTTRSSHPKATTHHALRHRHLIRLGNNIHTVAMNLREIASHRGACRALSQHPLLLRELSKYVEHSPIDISKVRQNAAAWNRSLPPLPTAPFEHGFFRGLQQASGVVTPHPSLRTPFDLARLMLSHPPDSNPSCPPLNLQNALRIAYYLLSENAGALAASLLTSSAIGTFQDQEVVRKFLKRAGTSITARDFDDYFQREEPWNPWESANHSPEDIFFETFRYSHGAARQPTQSRRALMTLIADFLHVGALAAASVMEDPSRRSYERLLGEGTLSMLRHQNWQPIFLNETLMREVMKLRSRGAKLIGVGNHRSHLDPILYFKLHPASYVAKIELLEALILGKNPFCHPSDPNLWQKSGLLCAFPHLMIDREGGDTEYQRIQDEGLKLMEDESRAGHSVFWLPEGTRAETPLRTEEVGALRSRSGAFKFALRVHKDHPRDTYVVVYAICGTGQILPTNMAQALKGGVRQSQPVIIAPCAILNVNDYIRNTPEESLHALEMAAAVAQARFLGEMQAANNNGVLVQAA